MKINHEHFFKHDDVQTINAVTRNINKNGLIFIRNQPLEIGDPIFIRIKKNFEKQGNTELHEGLHARVIWCHKAFNEQHDLCYKVGAEYFQKSFLISICCIKKS